MDDIIQRDILKELTIIKRLLACNLVTGIEQPMQISKLASLGFQPKEIAEMLGTTSNTVSVTLNRLRKATQRKVSKVTHK